MGSSPSTFNFSKQKWYKLKIYTYISSKELSMQMMIIIITRIRLNDVLYNNYIISAARIGIWESNAFKRNGEYRPGAPFSDIIRF